VRAVARSKPLIPERAWSALLAARSLRGEGPIVGVPAFRRVLVIAPHPDDESIGCGGLLALLAAAGCAIDVVFATDGEATRGSPLPAAELAAARRGEAEAACRVLGVTSAPRSLGLADGHLAEHTVALTEHLRPLAAAADALLVPWFGDGHPDHRAASEAVAALGGDAEVWGYETWTPLPANRLVDITPVIQRKEDAIAAHATAHLAFDVSASLGLNRYRSLHGMMGRGWAEAFLAAPAAAYADLVREHRA
jgi:LmbE family N-acetylglucosaminyl deacetylase